MPMIESKKLSITQWAEDDRPREKLVLKGRSALSDAELIAILIGSGTRSESAVDVAKRILAMVQHDLNKLANLTIKDLCKIKGIGEAKAISIVAALEVGRRRNFSEEADSPRLNAARLVYDYMKSDLLDLNVEQFWAILLKQNLHPIKKIKLADGGITGVMVDIRILFKEALEAMAPHLILVHNHPSGNKNPSDEDLRLTNRVVEGGKLLNIGIVEHLIFTNSGYYSFREEGKL